MARVSSARNQSLAVLALASIALGGLAYAFRLELAARPSVGSGRQPVAVLARGIRSVQRKLDREVLWENVPVDSRLFSRDSVRTAEGATARVRFDDGTQLDLAENSLVILDRSEDKIAVEFLKGSVFARGAKGTGQALEIQSGGNRIAMGESQGGALALVAGASGSLEVTVAEGSAKISGAQGESSIGANEQGKIEGGAVSKRALELRSLRPAPGARLLNRADGPLAVTFEWARGAGAQGQARLQISRDAAFEKIVQTAVNADDRAFVASLPEGSYFWRVVTQVVDPKTRRSSFKGFSESRALRVLRPSPARLESPESGARVEYLREPPPARFRWAAPDQSTGGAVDRIELAADPSFTAPLKPASLQRSGGDDPRKARTDAVFTSLSEGKYYWRVVTRYEDVGPDGKGVIELVTPARELVVARLERLPAPRPLSPASGATVALDARRSQVRLEWAPVAEASGYRVRVATDPAFKSVVLAEATLKPEWEGELQASGVLYWSVQASADAPTGPASDQDSKTTRPLTFSLSRSSGFRLLAPSDQESFKYYSASDKPEIAFRWEPRGGAAEYELQVSADERFGDVIFSEKTEGTSLSTRKAPAGAPYWRIRALDGDGRAVAVSQVGRYRLSEAPVLAAPEKTLPAAAAELKADPPPRVRFEWKAQAEAKGYVALLWKQDEGGRLKPYWSEETREVFVERELQAGNYQWTVRAVDHAGRRGAPGAPRSLFLRSPELLAAPERLDPPPGARIESARPKAVPIRWEPRSGAQGYAVQISRLRPDGSRELVRETQVSDSELVLPDTLRSGDYVWQVRAVGVAAGAPAGSKPRPGEAASSQFSIRWTDVLSAPSKMKIRLEEDGDRAPAARGGARR